MEERTEKPGDPPTNPRMEMALGTGEPTRLQLDATELLYKQFLSKQLGSVDVHITHMQAYV